MAVQMLGPAVTEPPTVDLPPPRIVRARPNRRPWLWLNLLGLTLATVPALLRILGSVRTNDSWEYAAVEWLINNHGGATRRGLMGDLLLAVPLVSARSALVLTVISLLLVVSGGFAVLVARAIRASDSPWPLLFWLVPAGVVMGTLQGSIHGNPIGESDFVMRKDYLFLGLLVVVVLSSARWPGRRAWIVIAGLSAAACAVGVFIHEGLGLVTAGLVAYFLVWLHPHPPAAVLTLRLPRHVTVPVPTVLPLVAPTVVAFGVVGAFASATRADRKVSWAAVDPATQDWLNVGGVQIWGADVGFPAPFWWLNTTPGDGFAWMAREYLATGAWIAWLITGLTVATWVLLGALLVDGRHKATRRYLQTIAVVAVMVLPLFIIAIDWGRWMALFGVTLSILILSQLGSAPRPRPATRETHPGMAVAVALVVVSLLMYVPVAGNNFALARLFD